MPGTHNGANNLLTPVFGFEQQLLFPFPVRDISLRLEWAFKRVLSQEFRRIFMEGLRAEQIVFEHEIKMAVFQSAVNER